MSITSNQFTIRVYGLLVHKGKVLLSQENIKGKQYLKLPGGGLEFGEGIVDALHREFMEELGITLSKQEHFWTSEPFVPSAFDAKIQVISIYYTVETGMLKDIKIGNPAEAKSLAAFNSQVVYWQDLKKIDPDTMDFPLDKMAILKLKTKAFSH